MKVGEFEIESAPELAVAETKKQTTSIFDKADAFSVYNMMKPVMQEWLSQIPLDIWSMDEVVMEKRFGDHLTNPLKWSFQIELLRARQKKVKINISNVCRDICSRDYFYGDIAPDPGKLAFIVAPPKEVTHLLHMYVRRCLTKLDEVLSLPMLDIAPGQLSTYKRVNLRSVEAVLSVLRTATDTLRMHRPVEPLLTMTATQKGAKRLAKFTDEDKKDIPLAVAKPSEGSEEEKPAVEEDEFLTPDSYSESST